METTMKFTVRLLALSAGMLAASVMAQTKWDLASAYPPTNFHTENLTQFVADVAASIQYNSSS